MHELSITQNIIDIVTQHANGQPVQRLRLEIGQLSAILPDSLRFCFDACTPGTVLEGATLEIDEVPGRGRCRQCGHEMALDMPFGVCEQCDSLAIDIIAGQDLLIKEMETAVCV